MKVLKNRLSEWFRHGRKIPLVTSTFTILGNWPKKVWKMQVLGQSNLALLRLRTGSLWGLQECASPWRLATSLRILSKQRWVVTTWMPLWPSGAVIRTCLVRWLPLPIWIFQRSLPTVGLLPQGILMEKISTWFRFSKELGNGITAIWRLKRWSNWNATPALALVAVVGCIRPIPWRQRSRSLGWAYQVPLLTLLNQRIRRPISKKRVVQLWKCLKWDSSHLTSWPVKPLKMRLQWPWRLVVLLMRPFTCLRSLTQLMWTWRWKTSTISKSVCLTWQTWNLQGNTSSKTFTMSVVCQPSWNTFLRMVSFTEIASHVLVKRWLRT